MRARLMNGYWVFSCPVGYRLERTDGHGKLLVRDEPRASILQEALEGFASGRFVTQAEVKRFLESQPCWPRDLPNGEIRSQRITELLTRIVYAGYIEYGKWDVSLRKGHHEGIISLETYERIQQRLSDGETKRAPARADIHEDFRLRGFITCDDCGKPLTANWSKSKTGKKHPYYLCFTKGCPSHRKSIRRDTLEGDFEGLLQRMQPTKNLFRIAKAMFAEIWAMKKLQIADAAKAFKQDIHKLEKQIEGLLDHLVDAGSSSVVKAYERRISKLEREKAVLEEKALIAADQPHTQEETFELAMRFLSNYWNIWKNGDLTMRKTVLRLAFLGPLPYSRIEGLRTPKSALPFKVLARIQGGKCEMAHRGGFEPPAPRFVVWCSIQLSYRCAVRKRFSCLMGGLQGPCAGRCSLGARRAVRVRDTLRLT